MCQAGSSNAISEPTGGSQGEERPSRHPQIQIHIQNHIRTPLDFYVNHSIDTVFHADYDDAILFSPHSKLWRPEASKDLGVGGPS